MEFWDCMDPFPWRCGYSDLASCWFQGCRIGACLHEFCMISAAPFLLPRQFRLCFAITIRLAEAEGVYAHTDSFFYKPSVSIFHSRRVWDGMGSEDYNWVLDIRSSLERLENIVHEEEQGLPFSSGRQVLPLSLHAFLAFNVLQLCAKRNKFPASRPSCAQFFVCFLTAYPHPSEFFIR